MDSGSQGFIPAIDLGDLRVGLFAQGILPQILAFGDLQLFVGKGSGAESFDFLAQSGKGDRHIHRSGADVGQKLRGQHPCGENGGNIVGQALLFPQLHKQSAG